MVKSQSQTVIVNVKQEKEKKPKRKRRTTKKGTKSSPQGVSQVSQNQSVNPIYRGVQEPAIQQRFLAPDPQTTRVLNDLSQALQIYKQQSTPQPPPPSNAVIVSPPVGAMPTPIAHTNKSTQKIKQAKMTLREVETLYPKIPKNKDGTIRKSSAEYKNLSEEMRKLVLMQEVKEKTKPKRQRKQPEPETEYETIDEDEEPEPSPMPMRNLKSITPSKNLSMLVNNSAAQLYSTSKLGQTQVQQNDIDDALNELD